MPDATIEHDTIEDAVVAKRPPLQGTPEPEEPEPGPIKQIRQAMREAMLRDRYGTGERTLETDDDPWLSIDNEAIWTVLK